ncbi:LysR family transcriptional regulator [Tersicoccus sp. MR15.9]|uniref:LysR family transcriptional regulator n=1 Tax=Tersicoccus mangrovi TaxID=3121635 RepID=UPI002FE61C4B
MSLDLNLLRTFLSIYDTRSVTRAAADLSLTQPTVSHALGRLRRHLGDPLFVRSGTGVAPTARAVELALVFRRAVTAVDDAVDADRVFDPATSERRFRIALSDVGEATFLPQIMERLSDRAPRVSVESVPMQIERVASWLAHGDVDAAVASVPIDASGHRTLVHRERYVCVLPADRAPEGDRIELEAFLTVPHVAVDPALGHRQADAVLESMRIQRRIGLYVHHFSTLPGVVAGCGMAAIVPAQLAALWAERWPIVMRELPIDVPRFDVTLSWNEDIAGTGAAAWFRDLVAAALRGADVEA